MKRINSQTLRLPNAVDFDRFRIAAKPGWGSPRDMPSPKRPILGYARDMAKWFGRYLPLLVGLIVVVIVFQASSQFARATNAASIQVPTLAQSEIHAAPSGASTFYLPFILEGPQPPPVLLGVYSTVEIADQPMVDQYLTGLDTWAGLNRTSGKGHSIWGDYISFEVASPDVNVFNILETPWSNGYTTFVNLSTSMTAAQIASGADDAAITAWAHAYYNWIHQGGNRRAFVAPLHEMNGSWPPYGLHPTDFKNAYDHIQAVFADAGVRPNQVWWTFAPNGNTRAGDPPIQSYYPGDDKVDIVAFSAYNCGTCPISSAYWQNPSDVFSPYIDIIRQQVKANKPIFIAATGSASVGGDKNQWLRDAYLYLTQQNIRGILYLNSDKECDWAVYTPDGSRQVQGYKDAVVSSSRIRYIAPASLSTFTFTP